MRTTLHNRHSPLEPDCNLLVLPVLSLSPRPRGDSGLFVFLVGGGSGFSAVLEDSLLWDSGFLIQFQETLSVVPICDHGRLPKYCLVI